MPHFFVDEEIESKEYSLFGEDGRHISKSLRMNKGESLTLCSPSGTVHNCVVEEISGDMVKVNVLSSKISEAEPDVKVTLYQALPKGDKMELIIQKSVELGAMEIVPVQMKRCVVKLDKKDKIKKIQRWQKISEVAAKQCGRNEIPEIKPCIYVKDVCQMIQDYDVVLVAYEKESENKIKNELKKLKEVKDKQKIKIGVVIGPEGGLEPEDVEMLKQSGAKIVTLGKRILRTETVALNVTSNIMYELED